MSYRIDQILLDLKLVRSRSQASELIKSGHVFFKGQKIEKPSLKISSFEKDDFEIKENELQKYVSRGGVKLQGALKESGLDVKGLTALDIGISTGGFSDCLLQEGITKVVGIDVGHDQLSEKFKGEVRLLSFEGVNAREFVLHESEHGLSRVDLVVADVSFISLETILPTIERSLDSGGHLLALVKPQFEVGRSGLGKGGRVSDNALYEEVEKKICQGLSQIGFEVKKYFESSIQGSDGNREFFVHAIKNT